jgi:acyl carrier protein
MDQRQEILSSIREFCEEQLGLGDVEMSLDTPISEFEIDSLEVIKLALLLEKRWQTTISAADVASAVTLGDIVDLIAARSNAAD